MLVNFLVAIATDVTRTTEGKRAYFDSAHHGRVVRTAERSVTLTVDGQESAR